MLELLKKIVNLKLKKKVTQSLSHHQTLQAQKKIKRDSRMQQLQKSKTMWLKKQM